MSDQQYFVPDISDLRIGDYIEIVNSKGKWIPGEFPNVVRQVSSLDQYADDIMAFAHALYRLPYLTQQQIESEGWKRDTDDDPDYKTYSFFKEITGSKPFLQYTLYYNAEIKSVRIERIVECGQGREDYLSHGTCRDINTLRYIQKLLNIK